MKLTTITLSLLSLSLSLSACATDDGSNAPTDPGSSSRLSQRQAAALFNSTLRGLDAGKSTSQGAHLLAPDQATIDSTFACDLGGHFDMTGTYDYNLGSSDANWDLQASFAACDFADVTMDGQIKWNHISTAPGDFSETVSGSLTVATQDLSTTCAFDVQIESDASGTTFSGTICGYDASGTIDSYPNDL
jgi:hypothetical protein